MTNKKDGNILWGEECREENGKKAGGTEMKTIGMKKKTE